MKTTIDTRSAQFFSLRENDKAKQYRNGINAHNAIVETVTARIRCVTDPAVRRLVPNDPTLTDPNNQKAIY